MPSVKKTSATTMMHLSYVVGCFVAFCFTAATALPWKGPLFARFGIKSGFSIKQSLNRFRGGDEEISLDEKVRKAMLKLGLTPPPPSSSSSVSTEYTTAPEVDANVDDAACKGGVCPMPPPPPPPPLDQGLDQTSTFSPPPPPAAEALTDPTEMIQRIAQDMNVDRSLATAAVGATATVLEDDKRAYDEMAARQLLEQELARIKEVSEDSPQVHQLISEGFKDTFLIRRALVFAEGNLDDARAILIADQMDEDEDEDEEQVEEQQQEQKQEKAKEEPMKTVTIDTDYDPTQTEVPASDGGGSSTSSTTLPKPAKKSDVVFEATAAQIQELVLESPVPVLLDVYADWCGPCKVLGPALEEMAVKSGGQFRLVKVNSDNERPVSAALEVTALPTVFGIKDGKILNMFQGMPRSEDAMKSFMMGLLMAESYFDPPVTDVQKKKYSELTSRMIKMAGAASFSFSARERLEDRVNVRLDELLEQAGDFVEAEGSAQVLRSLLSNVIRDPYSNKYRAVNLSNKVIAAKVGKYPACLAILKSVGFVSGDEESTMMLGKGKTVVNVAPLSVARECIDKWTDKNRYEVAAATRRRRDEEDRALLQKEMVEEEEEYDDEEGFEEEVDEDACTLKVRMEGKKKVHDVSLRANDPLRAVLEELPVPVNDDEEVQITCVAKRLVIKSTDADIDKSLRELGLAPSSSIVVNVGATGSSKSGGEATSKLSERAAVQKNRKKGSHTMQSVGIYAKDDNAKAELIDGGGGVWYEHDVTSDDEAEEAIADESVEEEIVDKLAEEDIVDKLAEDEEEVDESMAEEDEEYDEAYDDAYDEAYNEEEEEKY